LKHLCADFLRLSMPMDKSYDDLYGYPTIAFIQCYGNMKPFVGFQGQVTRYLVSIGLKR
jgi:hypothetical protein